MKCKYCNKRIWFWQNKSEPWMQIEAGTNFIVQYPSHFECTVSAMDREVKRLLTETIKVYEETFHRVNNHLDKQNARIH